jgi:hypothetical protein
LGETKVYRRLNTQSFVAWQRSNALLVQEGRSRGVTF